MAPWMSRTEVSSSSSRVRLVLAAAEEQASWLTIAAAEKHKTIAAYRSVSRRTFLRAYDRQLWLMRAWGSALAQTVAI